MKLSNILILEVDQRNIIFVILFSCVSSTYIDVLNIFEDSNHVHIVGAHVEKEVFYCIQFEDLVVGLLLLSGREEADWDLELEQALDGDEGGSSLFEHLLAYEFNMLLFS